MNEIFSCPDMSDFPQSMHLAMIRDPLRVQAYADAIQQTVSEGDVVLDVGSGTGILSILAAKAGAKKVYSVENSSIAGYTKDVVEQNGLSDVIEVLHCDIFSPDLPNIQADVVLSEFFGTFGIGENVAKILSHVRENYMKPGARMVPESMDLWLAPVNCSPDYRQITNWQRNIQGIDFSAMQNLAYNAVYHIPDNNVQMLAEPCLIKSIDFLESDLPVVSANVQFQISAESVLHGVAGWFSSRLSPGVMLENSPTGVLTHWGQVLFPTGASQMVQPGDVFNFTFEEKEEENKLVWRWKGGVETGSGDAAANYSVFEARRSL